MTDATVTLGRRIRQHPAGVLLAVQLVGVLAYPFMEDSSVGRAIFGVFGVLVLALAVWVARATPALTWVLILIGIPVVVLTVLEGFYSGNATLVLVSSLLHAVFYLYTAYGLIRYLFADWQITPDELFATGAAFTVLAWAFAYLFVALQVVWPGTFTAAQDPEGQRTWMELLFLSFTTLTSTGLSDVTPVLAQGRSVVMIEQVVGLMYVALVISRAVGLTLHRPLQSADDAARQRADEKR